MVEQKMIKIGEVDIPIIIEDGVEYYPISYLSEKVLLRKCSILSSSLTHVEKYGAYIKKFVIDMGFLSAGKQECKCMSFSGLKEICLILRTGRLDKEQKKRMKILNNYLNVSKEVIVEDRFCNKPDDSTIRKYSEFIQDAIRDVLSEDNDITWQCCNKCSNIYPFHENFFQENRSSPHKLDTYCKECKCWDHNRSKIHIRTNNDELNKAHNKHGIGFYIMCRDHRTIDIYNFYIDNCLVQFPNIISNKDDIVKIVKYLFKNGIVDKDNLTYEKLQIQCRINKLRDFLNMNDVYEILCGKEYFLYPWKYKSLKYYSETIILNREIAVKVFNNYVNQYRIKINDVLDYDYMSVAERCCIAHHVSEDILSFVVDLNEKKYGGYKYKIKSVNYYKNKENRIFDLKWFIENDLKVNIEKIPLYLTLTSMKNNSNTLHNVLKKYYKGIFEWVNEVYPDRFIETDFKVGFIRNEFDSMEENQINEILNENLKNVIYNQRNTDNTVTINGMQPDWIVLTDSSCWLIEYFGMYNNKMAYNTRVEEYIEKTHIKISKYDTLVNYKKLFIYLDDLKNNNLGLLEKIKDIV
jgi:hypothetical protein